MVSCLDYYKLMQHIHSVNVLLLGRYGCSSPSDKEFHGLVVSILQVRGVESGDRDAAAVFDQASGEVQACLRHHLGRAGKPQSRKQSDPGKLTRLENLHIYKTIQSINKVEQNKFNLYKNYTGILFNYNG